MEREYLCKRHSIWEQTHTLSERGLHILIIGIIFKIFSDAFYSLLLWCLFAIDKVLPFLSEMEGPRVGLSEWVWPLRIVNYLSMVFVIGLFQEWLLDLFICNSPSVTSITNCKVLEHRWQCLQWVSSLNFVEEAGTSSTKKLLLQHWYIQVRLKSVATQVSSECKFSEKTNAELLGHNNKFGGVKLQLLSQLMGAS